STTFSPASVSGGRARRQDRADALSPGAPPDGRPGPPAPHPRGRPQHADGRFSRWPVRPRGRLAGPARGDLSLRRRALCLPRPAVPGRRVRRRRRSRGVAGRHRAGGGSPPRPLAGRSRNSPALSRAPAPVPLRGVHGRPLTARAAVPGRTPSRPLVITGVMLGLFLGAMESTAVATAMPTVIASLGGLAIYSWVFSGYILAATVSMPRWGTVAALYGRRLAYLGGLGIFLAGSVLSGLAPSMTALIACRTLQGLGGGALIPLGMTIIADLYGLGQRARMQGYFSSTWGLASVVGP